MLPLNEELAFAEAWKPLFKRLWNNGVANEEIYQAHDKYKDEWVAALAGR